MNSVLRSRLIQITWASLCTFSTSGCCSGRECNLLSAKRVTRKDTRINLYDCLAIMMEDAKVSSFRCSLI